MIKLIVKLLIMLAVLNAAARGGMAAWNYYQFKDAAQQAAVFGGEMPTSTLHMQVMEKAAEIGIPIAPEQVNVHRTGQRTVIEASYVQPVEFFPRYEYPVPLRFAVEGLYAGNPLEGLK